MGTGPCRPFLLLAACTLVLSLTGCSHEVEDTPRYSGESIQLNMLAGSTREAGIESNALNWGPTLFFFNEDQYKQAAPEDNTTTTPSLTSTNCTYLLSAPEDVDTYSSALYDTGKKYLVNDYLYAAGYAPTGMLKPDNGNHATLRVDYGEYDFLAGSIDFLGCDADPAYRGSSDHPFGQPTNVLKFRHLTSKITFYAYRSKEMENKQYVRNVMITGLKMRYQDTDADEFFKLHTPTEFTWSAPEEKTDDNDEAGQKHWGYQITGSKENSQTSWIESGKTDGLLVGEERATILSAIYACDPCPHTVNNDDQLVLQMTVSAELSPDPAFPKGISEDKIWKDMTVEIMEFKNNRATENPVRNFLPGHEYKVYLQFKPTGVFLQGVGLPWIEEGPHYVPITPVSK